jgi:hypothetical protein
MNVVDITTKLGKLHKVNYFIESYLFVYFASSLSNLFDAGVLTNNGPAGSKPIVCLK